MKYTGMSSNEYVEELNTWQAHQNMIYYKQDKKRNEVHNETRTTK